MITLSRLSLLPGYNYNTKCDNKIHDFGNEYLHVHTQTSTVAYNYICDLIFQSTYNYTHNEPVHVCKLWLVEIYVSNALHLKMIKQD